MCPVFARSAACGGCLAYFYTSGVLVCYKYWCEICAFAISCWVCWYDARPSADVCEILVLECNAACACVCIVIAVLLLMCFMTRETNSSCSIHGPD